MLLQIDVHRTGHFAEQSLHLLPQLIQRRQIVPENFDGDLGAHPGLRLIHAMGDKLADVECHAGHLGQILAQPLEQNVGRHGGILGEIQAHVEFAEVGRLCIVVQITASGTLVDRYYLRVLEQILTHQGSQAH